MRAAFTQRVYHRDIRYAINLGLVVLGASA